MCVRDCSPTEEDAVDVFVVVEAGGDIAVDVAVDVAVAVAATIIAGTDGVVWAASDNDGNIIDGNGNAGSASTDSPTSDVDVDVDMDTEAEADVLVVLDRT